MRYPAVAFEIPLDDDPAILATKVGLLPGAAILESAPGFGRAGRWSILTAWPRETFEATGDRWRIDRSGTLINEGHGKVLDALSTFLGHHQLVHSHCLIAEDVPPFLGGAIGTIGYDLAPRIEVLPRRAEPDSTWPDIAFSIYDEAILVDNTRNSATLYVFDAPGWGATDPRDRLSRWRTQLDKPVSIPSRSTLAQPLQSNFTADGYCQAVSKALEYIAAGDIFQVNLSQRFEAKGNINPLDLYLRLKRESPAPYAAFLRRVNSAVISASPELYYRTEARKILTRPIKGTRPRGETVGEDHRLKQELLNSLKDRAELAMIVDLERNDLGRVCEYGSVRVTEAMALESFAQVHHMVATIEGRLRPDAGPVEVVKAMFPGGSITGAPKIRAMQIIDELEPTRRSLYTGSIGYFSRSGVSAFNIAIRTLLVEGDHVAYQVGGGIVADSDPSAEYQETLDKGRGIRKVLEER